MTAPRPLDDKRLRLIETRVKNGAIGLQLKRHDIDLNYIVDLLAEVKRARQSERFYLERFAESDPLRHDRNFKNYVCDCGFWLDENLVSHGKTDRRIDAPLHHSRCPWRIAVETVAKLKEK